MLLKFALIGVTCFCLVSGKLLFYEVAERATIGFGILIFAVIIKKWSLIFKIYF